MERWPLLVISLFAVTGVANAALPEPPQQHQPWKQPLSAEIPDYVIAGSSVLFDAGLADPRGGSYREIELAHLKTHGWVFDGKFAVCWDGMVYPVRSVGAVLDLDRDVRAIREAGPWNSKQILRSKEPPAEAAFWFDIGRFLDLVPSSVALLLRLNRPDLAAQLWRAREPSATVSHQYANEADFLGTSFSAWFGMAFRRLTAARDLEDDQEVVDVGESLLAWKTRLPGGSADPAFLAPVQILLADSKRRLLEPGRPFVDFRGGENGKHAPTYDAFLQRSQAVRIADLIDRLEDVRGAKITIPGSLMFSFDPICDLLIKEGEAAVEPLLDVYEHDTRLTRTLDYTRPWYLERKPIPVSDVVHLILVDILQAIDLADGDGAASLRAWWEKHKTRSLAARSFDVLADDHASPLRWLDSARLLTLRSDVRLTDGGGVFEGEDCNREKPIPPSYGEELRAHPAGSVSELLAKRVSSLKNSNSMETCGIAFAAFLWEPTRSLPVLQKASSLEECKADARVSAARLWLGDRDAAKDWSRTISDKQFDTFSRRAELSPLWMFPDDPILRATAERLFTKAESHWNPGFTHQYVHSPLLAVAAYRRAVVATLSDASVVGKATRSAEGLLSYQLKNGGGGSIVPGHDSRQIPPGQERPVRVKDFAAQELSGLDGAPEFQPDWPDFDKDLAITKIIEFLKTHEKEIRAFPGKPQDMTCPGESVYLKQ